MLGRDGAFAIGYKVHLPEKYSLSVEGFNLLNEELSISFKHLAEGIIINKLDVFLPKEFTGKHLNSNNFLEKSTKKYWEGYNYLEHTTYLFFVLPNRILKRVHLSNPLRPPQKKIFEQFDARQNDFMEQVSLVVKSIENIKLNGGEKFDLEELDESFINSFYDLYMSGFNEAYNTDIKKEWEYLRVGEEFVSILKFPQEEDFSEDVYTCKKDNDISNDKSIFYKSLGDNFGFDLNFKHIYSQVFIVQDNSKIIDLARTNQLNLYRSRNISVENEEYAQKLKDDILNITSNSDRERFIKGVNSVILFAKDEKELKDRIELTNVKFKEIDLKAKRVFGDNLLAIFEYCFPLLSDRFIEDHLYISSLNVWLSYCILCGRYRQDNEGILYNSRIDNTPVVVDLWDDKKKHVNARNFFILGPTGYGKSFNANHIITNYYQNGTKIVIIDLGGSYKKLSHLFKDDVAYISYREGERFGVNPFDIGNDELLPAKVEELKEFIGVHFKKGELLSDIEEKIIRDIIRVYYKHIEINNSFPSFIDFCVKNKENIISEAQILTNYFDFDLFTNILNEFVGQGLYASLYEGKGVDFGRELEHKKIVVFELDQIKDNKLLLVIMLMLVYSVIQKSIWNKPEERGLILFDEFAEQLTWNGILSRVRYYFQAIRKQTGSIGLVIQSESQIPKNEIADQIIDNTQILYVIYAKNYEKIKERFGLSEHAYYQMCSLRNDFNGKIPYSEIFIARGNTSQVYRLAVSREVFWAYQTEGTVNASLMRKYEEIGNMEEAIKYMIDDESKRSF
ncbi:MAG: TraG family conjugative transposon ATPase [Bacteroidota bacterium]